MQQSDELDIDACAINAAWTDRCHLTNFQTSQLTTTSHDNRALHAAVQQGKP